MAPSTVSGLGQPSPSMSAAGAGTREQPGPQGDASPAARFELTSGNTSDAATPVNATTEAMPATAATRRLRPLWGAEGGFEPGWRRAPSPPRAASCGRSVVSPKLPAEGCSGGPGVSLQSAVETSASGRSGGPEPTARAQRSAWVGFSDDAQVSCGREGCAEV